MFACLTCTYRTRVLYDLLADRLHTMAGMKLHEGKRRRVPSRDGPVGTRCVGEDLGDTCWNGRLRPNQDRVTVGGREVAVGGRVLGS